MSADTAADRAAERDETFKRGLAVLMAVLTLIAAAIAFLQGAASALDDAANRDTKRYSIEALGQQISGDARTNYDYNSAYQAVEELDILATSAEARGDDAAAQRYNTVREEMLVLSPLLAAPYYNDDERVADISRYEAETYLVHITELRERFTAASVVKDAWDAKSNTYIVHLTLLAVALFLFGMALAISSPATRWIFAGMGLAIGTVATVWAIAVYLSPVYDLRERPGAIAAYARGVGLAYQNRHQEAIAAFDEAIQAAPTYASAFRERAGAYAAMGDLERAAADYRAAQANGDGSVNVSGNLGWALYQLGRFDEARAANSTALAANPSELWVRFDQGLTLLSAGQLEAARAEYRQGMELAVSEVANARAAGQEPPSYLWLTLDDASLSLDELLATLDGAEGAPPATAIVNPEAAAPAAQELSTGLKSLAVALEYTGKAPEGALTAQIGPFTFGEPTRDEAGETVDLEVADTFEYGIQEVLVVFDYAGMRDGQEVIFKVYIDGTEDPSWRVVFPWEFGAEGTLEKPLSVGYSDVFVLPEGDYTVEMYVDAHLAQAGSFTISAP